MRKTGDASMQENKATIKGKALYHEHREKGNQLRGEKNLFTHFLETVRQL